MANTEAVKTAREIIVRNARKGFVIRDTELFDKLMATDVTYGDADTICFKEGTPGIQRTYKMGHFYMFAS